MKYEFLRYLKEDIMINKFQKNFIRKYIDFIIEINEYQEKFKNF